jgi:hypothetical protein
MTFRAQNVVNIQVIQMPIPTKIYIKTINAEQKLQSCVEIAGIPKVFHPHWTLLWKCCPLHYILIRSITLEQCLSLILLLCHTTTIILMHYILYLTFNGAKVNCFALAKE